MISKDLFALSRCRLFHDIPPGELESLFGRVSLRFHAYDPGKLIRSRGEPCDALYILTEGRVSAQFQDYNGRILRVETITAPDMIASAFLFAPEPKFPVNVNAVDHVQICTIDRESVISIARSSRGVMKYLFEDMASRTSFLAERLRLTQFTTLRQKVAGYLIDRCEGGTRSVIPLPSNQTALAELFGVARPSLGRVLHELEQSGVIMRERGSIRICNRAELADLLLGTD